jgi:hypothetical protein
MPLVEKFRSMNSSPLEKYKAALKTAWGYNDYNDWPIKYNSIMHLFIEEFTYEFLCDMESLKNESKAEELKDYFYNPARVFRIINPLIYGMKRLKKDIAYQRNIVNELLSTVKAMKYGSEFNEDNRNIIMSPGEIDKILDQKVFVQANEESKKIIQKFCGIIWAYTEAIFFRAHDVTKEIHGPYHNNLIIREYLNLRPAEIWKGIPLAPVNAVTIYTIYSNNLKIHIDPYNHLFHIGGNFKEDLLSYCIEIDGIDSDINELEKLTSPLLETINLIHKWCEEKDWKEITNRYADIYWYKKKPLCDLLGKSWKVTDSVRRRINNGNINEKRINNLADSDIERLINTII